MSKTLYAIVLIVQRRIWCKCWNISCSILQNVLWQYFTVRNKL